MRRNLGGPPRAVFGSLFNVTLGANQAMSVNIISGMTTPVLGADHPYYFYAQAQRFNIVGDGTMIAANCPSARAIMIQDLVAAWWQMVMASDPSQNPQTVLAASLPPRESRKPFALRHPQTHVPGTT